MTGSPKRKGDRAELAVQSLLYDLLGIAARRKLGAGRRDDIGDIDGIDDTVIQVVNWRDVLAAVRSKPRECETQQLRAGATFGATFVKLRGGEFRVVLTPDQWATYWRESQPIQEPEERLITAAEKRRLDCVNEEDTMETPTEPKPDPPKPPKPDNE